MTWKELQDMRKEIYVQMHNTRSDYLSDTLWPGILDSAFDDRPEVCHCQIVSNLRALNPLIQYAMSRNSGAPDGTWNANVIGEPALRDCA